MSRKAPMTEEDKAEWACRIVVGIFFTAVAIYLGVCFLVGIGAWEQPMK